MRLKSISRYSILLLAPIVLAAFLVVEIQGVKLWMVISSVLLVISIVLGMHPEEIK